MDPFIGQIAICAFPFAPKGWALCDGTLLPIAQNQALNALLGTVYGGDGRTTVGLPDLKGRTPVHRNNYSSPDYQIGAKAGVETVTLSSSNVPAHSHYFNAATAPAVKNNNAPSGHCVFANTEQSLYVEPQANGSDLKPMDAEICSSFGGSGAHTNMQPSLAVNFMIATVGLFPPRN